MSLCKRMGVLYVYIWTAPRCFFFWLRADVPRTATCNLNLSEVTINRKCASWMKIFQTPLRSKLFHIHWAPETSLGRQPGKEGSGAAGRNRASCDGFPFTTGSQMETPIVFSHNTCTPICQSEVGTLERASSVLFLFFFVNSKQWNQEVQ